MGPPLGAPVGSRPQPLWPGGATVCGARFTPQGGFGTVYLASDDQTTLLEVEAIFLSSAGLVFPGRRQPLTLIPVSGTLPDFLDLTTASIQRALHTSPSTLVPSPTSTTRRPRIRPRGAASWPLPIASWPPAAPSETLPASTTPPGRFRMLGTGRPSRRRWQHQGESDRG
ncbi:MAG: RES domain-containing protein [Dehalococcoidia bacterium]